MSKQTVQDELCMYILQIIRESPDPEKTGHILMDIMARISVGEDTASIEARYKVELAEIRGRIAAMRKNAEKV